MWWNEYICSVTESASGSWLPSLQVWASEVGGLTVEGQGDAAWLRGLTCYVIKNQEKLVTTGYNNSLPDKNEWAMRFLTAMDTGQCIFTQNIHGIWLLQNAICIVQANNLTKITRLFKIIFYQKRQFDLIRDFQLMSICYSVLVNQVSLVAKLTSTEAKTVECVREWVGTWRD